MKNALIIQEDLIILKLLERLMRGHGYECRAIRRLEELDIEDQMKGFDIIISDILFDGVAPLDVVFQIQEIIMHKSLIIVTNMGQKRIEEEVLATRRVRGFFAVPLDLDQIETLIA